MMGASPGKASKPDSSNQSQVVMGWGRHLTTIFLFGSLLMMVWIISTKHAIMVMHQPSDRSREGLGIHEMVHEMTEEERKQEEKLRENALKAARLQTYKYKKKISEEREALSTLVEEAENEDVVKENSEDADLYYYYYQDNNTTNAAVVGFAMDANFIQIKRFVGSLRYHGFMGTVILGVYEDTDTEILEYFKKQYVKVEVISKTSCAYEDAYPGAICHAPYESLKREWSYFPIARDFILDCEECSGPILFTTVHNVFFQANPFGAGMPIINHLHLFQEHWDVKYGPQKPTAYLLQTCKDLDHRKHAMGYLTSEIAISLREEMLEYLSGVYWQMKVWMLSEKCHFKYTELDTGQAIINFMRLSDRLPLGSLFKAHRKGVVNTVGYEGKLAYEAHLHFWRFKGLSEEEAAKIPYEGGEGNNWIDPDYKLTDKDGYFINIYFRRSAIVHEYEQFGKPYLTWLDNGIGKIYSNFDFDPNNPGNIGANESLGMLTEEQYNRYIRKNQTIVGDTSTLKNANDGANTTGISEDNLDKEKKKDVNVDVRAVESITAKDIGQDIRENDARISKENNIQNQTMSNNEHKSDNAHSRDFVKIIDKRVGLNDTKNIRYYPTEKKGKHDGDNANGDEGDAADGVDGGGDIGVINK